MSRHAPLWAVGLGSALLAGCLHPPLLFSPDGRWLAYTATARPPAEVLPPGWLFDPRPPALPTGEADHGQVKGATAYRIWATRADDRLSVLLEESSWPLTAPGWNPDGTAVAYGRLVPEGDGQARFELVIQDAPGRKRVLLSRPVGAWRPEASALPAASVAWSPDGRHLAVPLLQPPGLSIVRVESGRVLKDLPDAFSPSWSPDGGRLAFFRRGEPEGLYYLHANAAEPRFLLDAPDAGGFPAPAWSRDGRSVVVVRRAPRAGGAVQASLVRVAVESGQVETVRESIFYNQQPLQGDQPFLGASFALDRDGEDLFTTTVVEGQDSVLVWSRPQQGHVLKPFNPIDPVVPLGALAASPAGGVLALRAGPPGVLAPPALCEPTPGLGVDKLTPIVPDDAARAEWVGLLADAARRLLATVEPPIHLGTPVERPTLLPIPGELPAEQPIGSRVRHLARLGRPLCERPADAPPAGPDLARLLDEARLFFAYLDGDYAAALDALEAVEGRAGRADWRHRLLSLRAQVYLGLGDFERARGVIDYLRRAEPGGVERFERVGDLVTLSPLDEPPAVWVRYLAEQAEVLAGERPPGAVDHIPLGHLNPDNPAFDGPIIELAPALPQLAPADPFAQPRP